MSMGISKARMEEAIEILTTEEITRGHFETDYSELTAAELAEKYPTLFGLDPSKSWRDGLLYAVLDYFGIPRKTQVDRGVALTPSRPPPDTVNVTPQSIDRAFGRLTPISAEAGMSALASALMPYIRDEILDDLITALQVVKNARGTA